MPFVESQEYHHVHLIHLIHTFHFIIQIVSIFPSDNLVELDSDLISE